MEKNLFRIIFIALLILGLSLENQVSAKEIEHERDTLLVTVNNNSHVRYELNQKRLSGQDLYGALGSIERGRYDKTKMKYLKTCCDQMRMINKFFIDSINTQVASYMKKNKQISNHIFLLIGVDGVIINAQLSINNALIDMISNKEIIQFLKKVHAVRFPQINNTEGKTIGFRFHLNKSIENQIKFMQTVE